MPVHSPSTRARMHGLRRDSSLASDQYQEHLNQYRETKAFRQRKGSIIDELQQLPLQKNKLAVQRLDEGAHEAPLPAPPRHTNKSVADSVSRQTSIDANRKSESEMKAALNSAVVGGDSGAGGDARRTSGDKDARGGEARSTTMEDEPDLEGIYAAIAIEKRCADITNAMNDIPKNELFPKAGVAAKYPSNGTIANMIGVTMNEPYWIFVIASMIKRLGSDTFFITLPFFIQWVVGEDDMDLQTYAAVGLV